MRVLLLIHDVSVLGGMEIQVVNLANGLAARGDRVQLVSIRSSAATAVPAAELGLAPEVQLIHLGAYSRKARAARVPTLARLAARNDVVHCTGWDTSLWGRLAAVLARKPVIVADHAGSRAHQVSSSGASRANWIAQHNRLLDPFTATTVICAERQRHQLLSEGVSPDKIDFIPNGVPIARMRAQASSGYTREQLGIPAGAKVIAHVASFRPMKRQELALQTVARLRATVDEDVRIVFAGTGPEFDRVLAHARAIGADWATFLGPVRNVASVFALADLTILPSSAEAMPMVILESIGMGVPVVASDVGDVGAMLRRTGAGVVVPPDDEEALLETIRLLLTDPVAHKTLADAARAAAPEIDVTTMVSRYEEVFRRSLRPKGDSAFARAGAARLRSTRHDPAADAERPPAVRRRRERRALRAPAAPR